MMSYRIGSFNCCNCKDNEEKLKKIIELIEKEKLDMLLLQEFRFDKVIKLLPNWQIDQFTLAYQKDLDERWYEKHIDISEDIEDDTRGEYLRNPRNDTGYAIMYDSSKFTKLDFSGDTRWNNILKFRNSLNKVARPPQIEIFQLRRTKIEIAIMNLHLTYSGKFGLYKKEIDSPFSGALPDFDKMAKEKRARLDEMCHIFELYEKVNNYCSNGCHRTTLVGGDFNLPPAYLRFIRNTPNSNLSQIANRLDDILKQKVYTTTEYNEKYENIKDCTAEYNKNLKVYIDKKTTLHKLPCENEAYFYNSYDHFIVNQGYIKSDRINTVKWYKNDEGEEDNSIHYQKLSDHVPVYIDLNLT